MLPQLLHLGQPNPQNILSLLLYFMLSQSPFALFALLPPQHRKPHRCWTQCRCLQPGTLMIQGYNSAIHQPAFNQVFPAWLPDMCSTSPNDLLGSRGSIFGSTSPSKRFSQVKNSITITPAAVWVLCMSHLFTNTLNLRLLSRIQQTTGHEASAFSDALIQLINCVELALKQFALAQAYSLHDSNVIV